MFHIIFLLCHIKKYYTLLYYIILFYIVYFYTILYYIKLYYINIYIIQSIRSNPATALIWAEAPCKDAMLFSRRQASTILSFKWDIAWIEMDMDGVWVI